jgi:hypothetical protein
MNDAVSWTADFLAARTVGPEPITRISALLPDESRWFRKAIETRLFKVAECRADCPRLRRWKKTMVDEFITPSNPHRHLFSFSKSGGMRLNREYIPHIAAVARAVIDFGLPADKFSFSRYRTFQQDCITKRQGQSYETDAEFYAADGSIELQIEAKKDVGEIETIAQAIDATGTFMDLPAGCKKELEYILDTKPKYLWLVAPGCIDPEQYLYGLRVDKSQVEFRRMTRFKSATAG